MSTLKTGALRGTSGTADSVQLHASNQSVTFPGAVTITGALTSSTTSLGGKIKQILFDTHNAEIDTASGSYVDMGLEKAITPTSNSSNILIYATGNCSASLSNVGSNDDQVEIGGTLQVLRKVDSGSWADDWSTIAGQDGTSQKIQATHRQGVAFDGPTGTGDFGAIWQATLFGMDLAPGSGNTFTYKVEGKSIGDTTTNGNFRMNNDPVVSYLILIEYEP